MADSGRATLGLRRFRRLLGWQIAGRWRMGGLLLVALALTVTLGAAAGAQEPPPPQQLPPTGDPVLDNIYYGAVPPGGEAAPVLLFVHGLGGLARDWWTGESQLQDGPNDMYLIAHRRGYRTAFVTLNLDGQRGPGNDMWVNGETLSQQIEAVADHYEVEQVNLVAHSKGGVDAQTAIVYFGAAPRTRSLITLGSPHWGTQLADLAETRLGQQLLQLLGLEVGPAVLTLSTSHMQAFREATDDCVENAQVRYFSAGGTNWGASGFPLRATGRFLARFGPNDGLLTVASSNLPGARLLFVQPYHHFNVHVGRNAFPWIEAALQSDAAPGSGEGPVCTGTRPPMPEMAGSGQ